MVLETPIKANGQYVLDGKVFIIRAFGEGDFEIKTGKEVFRLFMYIYWIMLLLFIKMYL